MIPKIKRLPKAIKPYLEATTLRSGDSNLDISKKAVGYFSLSGCTFIIYKGFKNYDVIEFKSGARTGFNNSKTAKEAVEDTMKRFELETNGKNKTVFLRSVISRYINKYGYALQAKYSNLLKAN